MIKDIFFALKFRSHISHVASVISGKEQVGTPMGFFPSVLMPRILRCAIWGDSVVIFYRAFLLFSLLFFSFFFSQAQQRENKTVKFMAKVETRNSFVQTHYASFLGVRAGFEFKFPVRCGLGYYWMLTNFDSKFYRPSDFGQTDLTARPKTRYAIGYVDFSFYEEDDWTLSVPIQIGVGETFYRSENNNRFANGLIVPMEAGFAVDYLFTKWMGFGVGLGYRVMLKRNKLVKENFNSPYYQFRFNIAFSEIFRGIRKKKAADRP